MDWVQVDPLLNAAVAAVVAEGLVGVETACGFAAGPSQEARGSCLKETPELQEALTFTFKSNTKVRRYTLRSKGKTICMSKDVRCKM